VSEFGDLVEAFLDEYFRLEPLEATAAGMHEHDGRWPDVGETGRRARIAFADRWADALERLDDAHLGVGERTDRDLIRLRLASIRFRETDLRTETWNPLAWVWFLGEGLFQLQSREFAPLADRLASIAGRLEGLPAVVDVAPDVLIGNGDRPIARFHTQRAIRDLPGVTDLVSEAVEIAQGAAPNDPAVATLLPRLLAAADLARAAMQRFGDDLRDRVLPVSSGEGRLGEALFSAQLVHTFKNPGVTPDWVLEVAEPAFRSVRGEMLRLARDLWPTWRAGEPIPVDESAIVRGVLDAIAADHPGAEELLDFCRAELVRIEAFCRDRDLVGLADEPLDIQWTPVFLRSFGGAMLSSPGPLDRGQKAFFSITPTPDDWPEERRESYLREDNARMLRLLTIHEAVPGHYLQGVYANRAGSVLRAVFGDGVYAEGWAVYVTQVMMDVGFAADDPALWLVHWKFFLRSITNAIMDVRIHCRDMTEDAAMELMVGGGFQEEAEARAKYDRARLSSTQLSTYFVGQAEFWAIELEARLRAASAPSTAGGGAYRPKPRVVGGYGETPGFAYRPHLESLLLHGPLPLPLLRRLILGQEATARGEVVSDEAASAGAADAEASWETADAAREDQPGEGISGSP